MRSLAVLWLCAVAVAAPALADEAPQTPPVAPGQRIRLWDLGHSEVPIVGTVRAVDESGISLHVAGSAKDIVVPREEITRIELSSGRPSPVAGALLGAGLGAGIGALTALGEYEPSYSSNQCILIGALLGALFGAWYGAIEPPNENWKELSPSRNQTSFGLGPDHTVVMSFSRSF